ncbi:MAG: hypothetical protein ACREOO_27645 [bacterium]
MRLFFYLLSCAVFVVLASCSRGKVDVAVWNEGGAVDNVWLEWEGETVKIGNLAPGSKAKIAIHPHIESPLTVAYHRDGPFVCRNEAYFDSDWRGVICVQLLTDDIAKFSWIDRNGDSSAVTVECTRKGL